MAYQGPNQGQQSGGNKKPPKPKFEMIFTAGNPTKVGDLFQISANIQVCKDGVNQAGRQAEILFAGASVFNNLVTDASGRASGQFTIAAKAGEQAELTAVLLGSENASRTIRVNIPEAKKPKIATKADIEKKGKDGNYVIIAQILDEHGKGIKGKLIFTEVLCKIEKSILIGGDSHDTADDGTIKVILGNFKEAKRTIDVRVAGTALEKTLILDGPKQPMFRKPIKGGFLKNFKRK